MKTIPFTKEKIVEITKKFPTPFHLYDEKGIVQNANKLKTAFGILPGFTEFFAVKATPNPFLLKILKEVGFGLDCSSYAELLLAQELGFDGSKIMFTSNNTAKEEFALAAKLGAIINLDDFSHIEFLEQNVGLPDLLCLRFNPGPEREGNVIIGDPKEAKYGFTREQIIEGYKIAKEKGVKRFGLHTMIISNELNGDYFVDTAKMLFELVLEIKEKVDVDIEFVNLGGGIGIPYKPDQSAVEYEKVAQKIKALYEKMIDPQSSLAIYLECGRVITGPYGYLLSTVRHLKHIYKDYVGLDASMSNLMRPGMYGAYHHITVLGKESAKATHTYDVTGSLCENNDKFAVDRTLPEVEVGDIAVIHDAGAHGHSMGFQYNGKLRSAELLLRSDGSVVQIRRAENYDDYFATLDFSSVKKFKS